MDEHTQGRLHVGYGGQPGDGFATLTSPHVDYAIADLTANGLPDAELCANAQHLVACWNACEGISTAALEAGIVGQWRRTAEAVSR